MANEANAEGRDYWDGRAPLWDRRAEAINEFSQQYGAAAMDALAIEPGQRIVDVGCGPGLTTIELGRRVGGDGEVVGADISAVMVAAAARRAETAGLTNVSFIAADAQTDPLGVGFDRVYSRFGVMFFSDPFAAFANLLESLRPGGRLACAVWGPLADNPWMTHPTLAAAPVLGLELPTPQPDQPGPFSLAEPSRATALLDQTGYEDIAVEVVTGFRKISEASARGDLEALLEAGPTANAYVAADEATRQAAIDAVVAIIEPFREDGGWRLPGVAHVLTAVRP